MSAPRRTLRDLQLLFGAYPYYPPKRKQHGGPGFSKRAVRRRRRQA